MVKVMFVRGFGGDESGWGREDAGGDELVVKVDGDDEEGGDGEDSRGNRGVVVGLGEWVVKIGGGSGGCSDGILMKFEEMVKWEGWRLLWW